MGPPHIVAGVAKWLRPRVVVPVFVGSNPIIRPIFSLETHRLAVGFAFPGASRLIKKVREKVLTHENRSRKGFCFLRRFCNAQSLIRSAVSEVAVEGAPAHA